MRSARIAALSALALSFALPRLRAQETQPDTTPFHQRQWAAQFTAGTAFTSAGVLYFRSPRSAWLLDGSFHYNASKLTRDTLAISGWGSGGTIRGGLRAYRPLGRSILFFHTFGLSLAGGGGGQTSYFGGGRSWYWGVGAFADIGATYMLTPHFSLGAAAGASLGYTQTEDTFSIGPSSTNKAVTFSVGLLALTAAVYF